MKNLIFIGLLFAVVATANQEGQQTYNPLHKLDKNKNGFIELTEAVADLAVLNNFAQLDVDKDKRLSESELKQWVQFVAKPDKSGELVKKQPQGQL